MKKFVLLLLVAAIGIVAIVMVSKKEDPKETIQELRKDMASSIKVIGTEETDKGLMVFSVGKVNYVKDDMYFVDQLNSSIMGYKWMGGGGHVDRDYNDKQDYVMSLQLLNESQLDHPMVFGVLRDLKVASIEVETDGEVAAATIYRTENDVRLYVVRLEKQVADTNQLQVRNTYKNGSSETFVVNDDDEIAGLQEGKQIYVHNRDFH